MGTVLVALKRRSMELAAPWHLRLAYLEAAIDENSVLHGSARRPECEQNADTRFIANDSRSERSCRWHVCPPRGSRRPLSNSAKSSAARGCTHRRQASRSMTAWASDVSSGAVLACCSRLSIVGLLDYALCSWPAYRLLLARCTRRVLNRNRRAATLYNRARGNLGELDDHAADGRRPRWPSGSEFVSNRHSFRVTRSATLECRSPLSCAYVERLRL